MCIRDRVVEGLMSGRGIDFEGLLGILLMLLGLYGLSLIFSFVQGWIMADVSQKVIYVFRDRLSVKIDKLPLKYFDGVTPVSYTHLALVTVPPSSSMAMIGLNVHEVLMDFSISDSAASEVFSKLAPKRRILPKWYFSTAPAEGVPV